MRETMPSTAPDGGAEDRRWNSLYKIGGACALLSVAIVPIQIAVFVLLPPPPTVAEWFTLFQNNGLGGLLAFEILFVADAVIGIPTLLALYAALRRSGESFMAISLALGLVACITMIAARPAIEMLYLSGQYAAAADAQRPMLLAAGEAMRAVFNGTAFNTSNLIGNVNHLIVPLVMLRSGRFGKAAPIMGILSGVFGFAMYAPAVGLFLGVASAMFLAAWKVAISLRFFTMARRSAREPGA